MPPKATEFTRHDENRPEVPGSDICTAANPYSITSSAAAISLSGSVRPSIFAV